ncbi:MAG: hypothetical protein R3C19_06825 [Planctomycetaceae bacterium]
MTERVRNPNPEHTRYSLAGLETLQIPVLDFSMRKRFDELENQRFVAFEWDMRIIVARIDIMLRLDETGADFISAAEAGILGENGFGTYDGDRTRRLIFNKPFLLALKEPDASEPYFLAWIANGELMEAFKAETVAP